MLAHVLYSLFHLSEAAQFNGDMRALFGWLQPRDYIIIKFLQPASELLFFALLGAFAGQDPAYMALGNAVWLVAVSGLYGCTSVMLNERYSGTLPAIIAAPVPTSQTFVGRSLMQVFDGLTTVALGFILGGLNFSQVNWLWLVIALIIISYAVTGLGTLVATSGLIGSDLDVVMNLAYSALILLTGVNFAVALLPEPARLVAHLLPLTHGLSAVRQIFEGALAGIPRLLFLEALIGTVYWIGGYALFRTAEYRARVKGTLELV